MLERWIMIIYCLRYTYILTKELIVFGEKVWQWKKSCSQLFSNPSCSLAYLLCRLCFCTRPKERHSKWSSHVWWWLANFLESHHTVSGRLETTLFIKRFWVNARTCAQNTHVYLKLLFDNDKSPLRWSFSIPEIWKLQILRLNMWKRKDHKLSFSLYHSSSCSLFLFQSDTHECAHTISIVLYLVATYP